MNRKRGRPKKQTTTGNQLKENIKVTKSPSIGIGSSSSLRNRPQQVEDCTFCGNPLSQQGNPTEWDNKHEKNVIILCKMLKLNLEEHNLRFDFQNENYPFCQNCSPVVDEIESLHQQMKRIQSKIDSKIQGVQKIVQKLNSLPTPPSSQPQPGHPPLRQRSSRILGRKSKLDSEANLTNKCQERNNLIRQVILSFECEANEDDQDEDVGFDEGMEIKQEIDFPCSDEDNFDDPFQDVMKEDVDPIDHSVSADGSIIKSCEGQSDSGDSEERDEFQLFIQEQLSKEKLPSKSPMSYRIRSPTPTPTDASRLFQSFVMEQMQKPIYKNQNVQNSTTKGTIHEQSNSLPSLNCAPAPTRTVQNRNKSPTIIKKFEGVSISNQSQDEVDEFEAFMQEQIEKRSSEHSNHQLIEENAMDNAVEPPSTKKSNDQAQCSLDFDFASFLNEQLEKPQ